MTQHDCNIRGWPCGTVPHVATGATVYVIRVAISNVAHAVSGLAAGISFFFIIYFQRIGGFWLYFFRFLYVLSAHVVMPKFN